MHSVNIGNLVFPLVYGICMNNAQKNYSIPLLPHQHTHTAGSTQAWHASSCAETHLRGWQYWNTWTIKWELTVSPIYRITIPLTPHITLKVFSIINFSKALTTGMYVFLFITQFVSFLNMHYDEYNWWLQ